MRREVEGEEVVDDDVFVCVAAGEPGIADTSKHWAAVEAKYQRADADEQCNRLGDLQREMEAREAAERHRREAAEASTTTEGLPLWRVHMGNSRDEYPATLAATPSPLGPPASALWAVVVTIQAQGRKAGVRAEKGRRHRAATAIR